MSNRHTMAKDREGTKCYLGDGAYAVYDGFGIWLTAEDGMTATDAVYLEPPVLDALLKFVKSLKGGGG